MTKKITLSAYSLFLSAILLAVLLGGLFLQIRYDGFNAVSCLLLAILWILCCSTLLFSPLSVSLESDRLCVNFALRCRDAHEMVSAIRTQLP